MGGDQTFVKPLGLDCLAFTQLLRPFAKLFIPNSIRNANHSALRRKKTKSSVRLASRSMTADGCLALALMFLSSEGPRSSCSVFYSGSKSNV
jgi:hypothetical protein